MMNDNTLTASQAGGSQTSTQSPQMSSGANPGGTPTTRVQQGTASDVLRSDSGISLTPTAPTTVNLGTATQASVDATSVAPPKQTNYFLVGIAIICVIAAVAMVWGISRAAKNTTYN